MYKLQTSMKIKIYLIDENAIIFGTSYYKEEVRTNDRGEPTASVLSADGYPLLAGPNFQPKDGNPTVISILRQLAGGPENVPEI